jgi:4-aminobutyrate aminotransferase-like enzyme
MSTDLPPTVREILDGRGGEEMALNDRYLNPQMGRILRTLGFDKVWARGEGAHLVDARGERYLDLLSGYGVFAIGRNHPAVIAAVEEVLAARTANLPQLGVTLLSGVLAEQLLARAPGSVAAMVPASTGTEAVEAASARCWPAAIPSRSATSTAWSASWNAETWPRSWSSRCRARASTCRRRAI